MRPITPPLRAAAVAALFASACSGKMVVVNVADEHDSRGNDAADVTVFPLEAGRLPDGMEPARDANDGSSDDASSRDATLDGDATTESDGREDSDTAAVDASAASVDGAQTSGDGPCDGPPAASACSPCGPPCVADPPSTAACVSGRCLVTLASGRQSPGGFISFTVDSTSVYWTEPDVCAQTRDTDGSLAWACQGRIMSILSRGGEPVTLAAGRSLPESIAVQSANLYWAENASCSDIGCTGGGSVLALPLDGGSPVTLATDPNNVLSLAATSEGVYWTDFNESQCGPPPEPSCTVGTGGVNKVPMTGGQTTTLATGQWPPFSITADDSAVYWAGDLAGTINLGPGGPGFSISESEDDSDGGSVTTVVPAYAAAPITLALDSENLYWAVFWSNTEAVADGGAVMAIPRAGGAPTILVSGADQNPTGDLAIDTTSVFWSYYPRIMGNDTETNGTIAKALRDGGSATVLASGQTSIRGLAVDATSVYWTTCLNLNTNCSLMKLTPK